MAFRNCGRARFCVYRADIHKNFLGRIRARENVLAVGSAGGKKPAQICKRAGKAGMERNVVLQIFQTVCNHSFLPFLAVDFRFLFYHNRAGVSILFRRKAAKKRRKT